MSFNNQQQRFISVRSGPRVSINSAKSFKAKDSDQASFKSCKDDGDFQSARGDEEEGSCDESSENQSELQYRDARASLTELKESVPAFVQQQSFPYKQTKPVLKEDKP